MQWQIPMRIIEYGRFVIIEADTRTEAIAKLRRRDWIECTDPDRCEVVKTGSCVRLDR